MYRVYLNYLNSGNWQRRCFNDFDDTVKFLDAKILLEEYDGTILVIENKNNSDSPIFGYYSKGDIDKYKSFKSEIYEFLNSAVGLKEQIIELHRRKRWE